ncbi:MAG: response regulator [Candidatus Omnitrophica bacterium]|nr:response regulator [Candidatus Omnitrophota bacterium]
MEKKKILVVDDEEDLIKFVKVRLEANNYEVFFAYDGQEALNVIDEVNPDLLILDIMLPKKNGYEVCEKLKKDPKYSHLPILMLTAKDQQRDVDLAKEMGADAFICKPFEAELLLYDIKNLLHLS